MSDNKIMWVLQSRKFWSAVIGLVLILVTAWQQDPFPTEAVVTAILGIVAAYIGATALEDGLTNSRGPVQVADAQQVTIQEVKPNGTVD